jgi:chromosomal replication initiation ATPase DnaA
MYYAATQQVTEARHIARTAQQRIKDRTGMNISVLLCPVEATPKTPERMLRIIAESLGMSANCYRMKNRSRPFSELRFIAAHILRQNFATLTLHQIALFFGGLDHTSVINGLTRVNNLIHTGDTRFIEKYNQALKAVNLWLRRAE